MFLCAALSLGAAPILVEAYQKEGTVLIPEGQADTIIASEITFSLNTACLVQLATGGNIGYALGWLVLDGKDLIPNVKIATAYGAPGPLTLTYTYPMSTGEHMVSLCVRNYSNINVPSTCSDCYLQALIFLPDTVGEAIVEQPVPDAGKPVTSSLISRGPFVQVLGATMVVDASGRVIENAIEDGRVSVSTLPAGTYFAKEKESTIVKIVKVE
jgi:hypothetical protein